MRWEDERYVRLYTRDTIDWLALSFEAQGLLGLLLRKVDRAGIVALGKHGKRGVAAIVGHMTRWETIEPALEELLTDGCVVLQGDRLVFRNFIEAQETPSSDAQRKRDQRERDRDKATSANVLPAHPDVLALAQHASEPSRNAVTEGSHAEVSRPDVTQGGHVGEVTPSVPNQPNQIKEKEGTSEKPEGPPSLPLPATDEEPRPSKTLAEEKFVFEHWKRVRNKRADTKFSNDRRAKIRGRLREKFTVEQLCKAIDGIANDPWDQRSLNGNDDLTIVLREATQVEKFLEHFADGPPKRAPATGPPAAGAMPSGSRSTGIEATERALEEQRKKRAEIELERKAKSETRQSV